MDARKSVPKHKTVTYEKMDKFPPYKTTGDFILSKYENRVITKYPKFGETAEHDLVLEQTTLLNKNIELKEKREECIERRRHLQEQWDDIEEKEANFKSSFLYFNKFVRENMEKRERASKKTGDDIALKEKRTAEVNKMKGKLNTLTNMKKGLDILLRKYYIFEDYLQSIVRNSPMEFKTIDHILNRYESLMEAKIRLAETQEEGLSELEQHTAKMMKMGTEFNLVIMGLNNNLAALEERYKRVNEFTLGEEKLLSMIKFNSIQGTAEIESVKSSIFSIYRIMCERKKMQPSISETDHEQLLTFIKKCIQETVRGRRKIRRSM